MSLGGIIGQAPDLNEYLPKSGGTMTGPLVLSGNPSGNLEAASKQYVDSKTSEWKKIGSASRQITDTSTGDRDVSFIYTTDFTFDYNLYSFFKFEIIWDINLRAGDYTAYITPYLSPEVRDSIEVRPNENLTCRLENTVYYFNKSYSNFQNYVGTPVAAKLLCGASRAPSIPNQVLDVLGAPLILFPEGNQSKANIKIGTGLTIAYNNIYRNNSNLTLTLYGKN